MSEEPEVAPVQSPSPASIANDPPAVREEPLMVGRRSLGLGVGVLLIPFVLICGALAALGYFIYLQVEATRPGDPSEVFLEYCANLRADQREAALERVIPAQRELAAPQREIDEFKEMTVRLGSPIITSVQAKLPYTLVKKIEGGEVIVARRAIVFVRDHQRWLIDVEASLEATSKAAYE
jgi:hypothetical protein